MRLVVDLTITREQTYLFYLVVLLLNVGGFIGLRSFEEELVVFYLFGHGGNVAFDFVDFDGVFSLFLVEGL